ncbi:type IV pilus modification PilV family protein [Methylobacter psychrophilus]|uniref:type IV pilus modification PilV family protein n=1 Tax=Methylobacter psychrophilus TaxID=96941 RepID=UPI0021D50548|nr:prepilin-type N-terminal cleavage/methylation domain-containing protein [Methylobacter psychrophilus]
MGSEVQLTINKRYYPLGYKQAGVTLIELILSMLIISIAVTGVFSVINLTVSHSADPVVQYQAIAIAEAYLEEILLQSFTDPNGTNAGETRASYDNVADYNGLNDVGAYNQQGALMSNLSSYNVSVAVVDQSVSGLAAKEITVTVSGPGVSGLTLVGYKFAYL